MVARRPGSRCVELMFDLRRQDLVRAISRAIEHVRSGRHDPLKAHEQLKEMYSWTDVAERTENVYYRAMAVPEVPVIERLRR